MQYLLNTNHAVALLNRDPRTMSRLSRERDREAEFGITTVTLGELYYGAYNSQKVEENLDRIRTSILPSFVIYSFDLTAADEFGRIQAELRAKGSPIPTADAQIAAIARLRGATVLTSDAHFSLVQGLRVEDWLG